MIFAAIVRGFERLSFMPVRKLQLLFACAFVAASAVAQSTPAPKAELSARDIVLRALKKEERNLDLRRNYTFQRREVEKELEKDGRVKKTTILTYDVLMVGDRPYSKLIARNDQPLSAKEQREQEEKLQKASDQRKRKQAERERKKPERDEEERKMLQAVDAAYSFRVAGEEMIDGHPAWQIEATRNPQFKPSGLMQGVLSRVQGRLWIGKEGYEVLKLGIDVVEDWSVGLFLAKLYKGTHFDMERTRVNDEIWLPKREYAHASARIGWKSQRVESETVYSNYRKFRTEAKITGVTEAKP